MLLGQADLDTLPPIVDADPGAWDVQESHVATTTAAVQSGIGARIAKWADTQAPTAQACRDRIATHHQKEVSLQVGESVCAQTTDDRIAAVTVTGLMADQRRTLVVQATVWGQ